MHLAAALGVPVVAVLQIERSLSYAPKGEQDRSLMRPRVADVVHTLMTHPMWPVITGSGDSAG
jgi:heptosyltransferase-3